MKRWKKYSLGLALASGLTSGALAQIPAVPGAPAAPAGVPAAVVPATDALGAPGAAVVAVPKPGGVLGNLITAHEYCKAKLCASPLGQMLGNMMRPASLLSGGMIPPLCPPNAVNPADLAKPSDSALGAAARIKADEAEAGARKAAVRYLGTVDCRYWPEAQDALVTALRADRNECVRFEAALALGSGCCCTPVTVKALSITVAGSDADGNPPEVSERVKSAAEMALSQCVARTPPAPPEVAPENRELIVPPRPEGPKPEGPRPEGPRPEGAPGTSLPGPRAQSAEWNKAMAQARQVLEKRKEARQAVAAQTANWGRDGLVALAAAAMNGPATPISSSPTIVAPTTVPEAVAVVKAVDHRETAAPALAPASAQPLTPVPMPPLKAVPAPAPKVTPAPSTPAKTVPAADTSSVPAKTAPAPATTSALTKPAAAPAVTSAAVKATPAPTEPVVAMRAPVTVAAVAASHPTPYPVVMASSSPDHPAIAPTGVAVVPHEQVGDYLTLLDRGSRAEDRIWAAKRLAGADWHSNPAVAESLLEGARGDPAAEVRLACLASLVQLHVDNQAAVGWYETLSTVDGDPRVRRAAGDALTRFKTGSSHDSR